MGITLIQWNDNSLSAHSGEFKRFIEKHNPDIICIQETHLKTNKNYTLRGYNVERKDREGQRKGGVAILIKQSISYSVIKSEPSNKNIGANVQTRQDDINETNSNETDSMIESIGINIRTRFGEINLINIYNQPQNRINKDAYLKIIDPIKNNYYFSSYYYLVIIIFSFIGAPHWGITIEISDVQTIIV